MSSTGEKPVDKKDSAIKSEVKADPVAKEDGKSSKNHDILGEEPKDPVGEAALYNYPERRGGTFRSYNPLFSDPVMTRESCEYNVLTILKNC